MWRVADYLGHYCCLKPLYHAAAPPTESSLPFVSCVVFSLAKEKIMQISLCPQLTEVPESPCHAAWIADSFLLRTELFPSA